jgi:hypothetical protein
MSYQEKPIEPPTGDPRVLELHRRAYRAATLANHIEQLKTCDSPKEFQGIDWELKSQIVIEGRRVVLESINAELDALLGGPADREAQRQSFAYGNANLANPDVTREIVRQESERLSVEAGQVAQHGQTG